jgi:nucleoid-associated protein EbfC
MNIQKMMQQAQEMQERLQKQMGEMRVEGAAGGGMVAVTVSGTKQLLAIKLDPEVVSKDDLDMLQDLIVAAMADAHRKVDDALANQMQGMLGGMRLPGMG